jgi:hypothetical protein
MFVKHDHLIFAINERYPEMVHGRDFWVAHPTTQAGEQIGDAFIASWPEGPPPDVRPLLKRAVELLPLYLNNKTRDDRTQLLLESDWAMMPDAQTDKAAWGEYRQALRDLPAHPNWPQIDWPERP